MKMKTTDVIRADGPSALRGLPTYPLSHFLTFGLLLLLLGAAAQAQQAPVDGLAPLYVKYQNDRCFTDEHTNCVAVDITYAAAKQRAGVSLFIEYGSDLAGWSLAYYSSAWTEDQLVYFAWFTQVESRVPYRFFRARESDEVMDFFVQAFPNVSGLVSPPAGLVASYSGAIPLR